ncbi:tyrosine-type recombinase/integrase [Sulfobacillus harzensis]|uniref:Tyrosine-type recombinase/integrase n=1 Tax=Sulfobacillus harzensis TaxID=2729629 RepID=A0A7Y0Q3W2_9FIRM|nr:tyrosine-type recombinase/integrase [Sulfobacillus harzensis]NMP24693.1 tyrosine-type recombinase/integrase [Sulfobacillus harzensis]
MDERETIRQLVDRVLKDISAHHYASTTQANYRGFYHQLLQCADARGIGAYSSEFGHDFFHSRYRCRLEDVPSPAPRRLSGPRRYLTVLDYYHRYGTLPPRRPSARAIQVLPTELEQALADFNRDCTDRGHSPRAARTRQARVRHFLTYMANHGIPLTAVTGSDLSHYTTTLMSYQPKTVRVILSQVRTFLRFLHRWGLYSQDLSRALPPVRMIPGARLPHSWPIQAVSAVLAAVDRGTPLGKRDYAILLLAARLGLRVGDITTLPLTALHWQTKTVAWVQQKTGRTVELPLLDDVGWAIIDYLRNGRPETEAPCVFVRHRAPFEPFAVDANLHGLLMHYVQQAGVTVPAGAHGMHALRHGLAGRLLSADTPLPVIADVLGHRSTQSTQVYLAVDEAGLRRCALNPEEVLTDVHA